MQSCIEKKEKTRFLGVANLTVFVMDGPLPTAFFSSARRRATSTWSTSWSSRTYTPATWRSSRGPWRACSSNVIPHSGTVSYSWGRHPEDRQCDSVTNSLTHRRASMTTTILQMLVPGICRHSSLSRCRRRTPGQGQITPALV